MKQDLSNDTTCPKSRSEWRDWLMQHHATQDSVWVVYHKKASGIPRVTWKDAVEEALCFGWIDGRAQPIDEHTYRQFFCRRKPGGTWSKINKESVERLISQGLMTRAGLDAIETAKQNGAWNILDVVDEGVIPDDLATELGARPGAAAFFESLSRSTRHAMLQWLVMAKRPETRQKRIAEITTLAAEGRKPKPFSR